jgi:hypothetical protein
MRFSGALWMGAIRALMPAILVTTAVALSGSAGAQAGGPLFVADQEACFGRVYDRAHLAVHPNQTVTSFHIFRYLGERPEAESWQASQRDEAIKRFRRTGYAAVQAFVTFRGRPGYFHNWLLCAKEAKEGTKCSIECDGGSFDLKRESAGTVLLNNNGFILIGGCSEDVEASKEVYFAPGRDDKVFRLEAKAVAICRAEERKTIPIRPGKPLRERFQESELFCFGRDYEAAHLAKHPQQKVVSIRVGRLNPEAERRNSDQKWPDDVKLSVALTVKAATTRRALTYVCSPREASWECTAESVPDAAASSCDGDTIHLARGRGEDILLINRKEGLPIDAPCQAKLTSEPSDDHQQPTRSDDRTFRLVRMPIEACR